MSVNFGNRFAMWQECLRVAAVVLGRGPTEHGSGAA
jgi:hypothetical protein